MKTLLPELTPDVAGKANRVFVAPYRSSVPYTADGTEDRPYRFKDLREVLRFDGQYLGGMFISLFPGVYPTSGIQLRPGIKIEFVATDPGSSYIVLNALPGYHIAHIFSSIEWVSSFFLYGLSLDGNWPGNDKAIGHNEGSYKIAPVSVRAWRGKVEKCSVIGHGADGLLHKEGWETFPLRLETWNGGSPAEKYTPALAHLALEPNPQIEIRDCDVGAGYYLNGGYATDIFCKTSQPSAGDRFGMNVRDTISCLIHGCRVADPGAIAYGCAESDNVVFDSNKAENCKTAFNFDTGSLYRGVIRNLTVTNCSQGINLQGASNDVKIEGCNIQLSDPFFNKMTQKTEEHYCVRTRNNRETVVNGNTFAAMHPSGKLSSSEYVRTTISGVQLLKNNSYVTHPFEVKVKPDTHSDCNISLSQNETTIAELRNRLMVRDGIIKELQETKEQNKKDREYQGGSINSLKADAARDLEEISALKISVKDLINEIEYRDKIIAESKDKAKATKEEISVSITNMVTKVSANLVTGIDNIMRNLKND